MVLGDEVGDLIPKKWGSPQKKVTIAPFAMAWAPVTMREYREFVESSDFSNPRFWTHAPRKIRGTLSEHAGTVAHNLRVFGESWAGPALDLSLYDALAYCAWRTAKRTDGRVVRLPTEAEWEYVARAHAGGPYPWGAELPAEEDFSKATGWSGLTQHRGISALIGLFPPIGGVVDLIANVAQWCDSAFDDPYGERQTVRAMRSGNVVAPTWTAVLRGGVDDSTAMSLRCAFRRGGGAQPNPAWMVGARLVLDPPPEM